jgi:hypothetical protein
MATQHPCGELPVSGFHLDVWYCAHHQAFWAQAHSTTEDGETPPQELGRTTQQFGPFDSDQDVTNWAQRQLAPIKRLPLIGT